MIIGYANDERGHEPSCKTLIMVHEIHGRCYCICVRLCHEREIRLKH